MANYFYLDVGRRNHQKHEIHQWPACVPTTKNRRPFTCQKGEQVRGNARESLKKGCPILGCKSTDFNCNRRVSLCENCF